MLLEMPVVANTLSELQQSFESLDRSGLYDRYLALKASVEEWRFSTGEYFSCLPYEDERMGFASPRLLEERYASVDEARWRDRYSAGFLGGRHVVTVMPGQKAVQAVSATFYCETDGRVEACSATHKIIDKPGRLVSQVDGLSRMVRLDTSRKLYVSVGVGGAYAVYLYEYGPDGKPRSATAFSKGWSGESGWEFHHDAAGTLERITSGAATLWTRA